MANDRHSQSRRNGRNKNRSANLSVNSQCVSSANSRVENVAVVVPRVRPIEVKSQTAKSQVSVTIPDKVAVRAVEAIEAVDALAHSLHDDTASQPAPPPASLPASPPTNLAPTNPPVQLPSECDASAKKEIVKPKSTYSRHLTNRQESVTPVDAPISSHRGTSVDTELAWSQAVDAKLNELIERSRSLERESVEIESLRAQLQQAIGTAENRLSSNSDAGSNRIEELENQLIAAQEENRKTTTLLLHARQEYQELLSFIESEAVEEGQTQAELKTIAQRVLEKTDARETELGLEVSQLNDQLQFLQSELKEARAQNSKPHAEDSELRIQIEQLRSQLLEARHEAVELRMQSNDLGSRLAKFQNVSSNHKSETLTWEQRKEALLQQLEAETHAETPCDPRKVLEIEKVIEQTTSEIQRRDEEIADLKALIEQQSIAHEGMSIGVSAVAEMIESDALIVSERLRLKELREDWEQKQRQAEIEMSMERAKLARERLELQEKTRNYDDNNIPQTEEEKKATKAGSRGKWLARLGLRDE